MRWRWAVVFLIGFAVLELGMGAVAYSTPTWNFGHTDVLYGWDNVASICLILVPICLVIALGVIGMTIALIKWAVK